MSKWDGFHAWGRRCGYAEVTRNSTRTSQSFRYEGEIGDVTIVLILKNNENVHLVELDITCVVLDAQCLYVKLRAEPNLIAPRFLSSQFPHLAPEFPVVQLGYGASSLPPPILGLLHYRLAQSQFHAERQILHLEEQSSC